jgi:hypothetical protein
MIVRDAMCCKCVPGAVNGTGGRSGHAIKGTVPAVHSAVRFDCKQPCCKPAAEPVHADLVALVVAALVVTTE